MAVAKSTQNDPQIVTCSASSSNFDVFLSFSKEENLYCKDFVNSLYRALRQAGIQVFKDDHHEYSPETILLLSSALQQSRVSIVVFSKCYASSTQCLDELVNMMDRKRTTGMLVLPVFYDVDPSHVRRQFGIFGEALARHEEQIYAATNYNQYDQEKNKVESWRIAMTEAANLSGWDLRNIAKGHESKFIQKIVNNVLGKVSHKGFNVPLHPVGIDSRVEDVIHELNFGSEDVRVMGIYGMGGIGKTTVAQAVYNSISHLFEGSCFLSNVKEVSEQPEGIVHLQEQLLCEILGQKNVYVGTTQRGVDLIKDILSAKRVLIVLDDLNQSVQFNSLVGHHHCFGAGSKIIFTTRDVLLMEHVDKSYKARELDEDESLELFQWHAFGEIIPLEDYVELSEDIVKYTGGLPLALQVLGSYLCGRTITEWKSALQKLQLIPNNDIMEILRISFDALSDDDMKVIFLDIACFFVGRNIYETINILNACGFPSQLGVNLLIQRCLLTVNDDNNLMMHDLVRDMGREVIRQESPKEPGKRSRLWKYEDVCDVLNSSKGAETIEGLILDVPESTQLHFSPETFAYMSKLRLLQINNVHLTGSFENIFQELKWLCWHHCNLKCLPSSFYPEKLVLLDLQNSNLNTLWSSTLILANLKTLNLKNSKFLTTSPDFVGVPSLQQLILVGCESLSVVDSSIGHLSKLSYLDMSDCSNLENLPSSICKLRSLEHLYLRGCSILEQLPEQFGDLQSLRILYVGETAIKQLPNSIYLLKNLQDLSITNCNKRFSWFSTIFPSRILTQGNSTIKFVLPSITCLSALQCLDLRYCNLTDDDILHDLGSLNLLKLINLSGNMFRSLPSSLYQLSNLVMLTLGKCRSLQTIPELPPNLQFLYASECTSLVSLPSLSNLKNLRNLHLPNCCRLREIQGFESLISIRSIRLDGCSILENTFEKGLLQAWSEHINCKLFLPRKEIPAWFSHQTQGSSIAFDLPVYRGGEILVGMTLWVVFVSKGETELRASIKNETNGNIFTNTGVIQRTSQENSWVSYLSKLHGMKGGHRISVCIYENHRVKVKKCGIHLFYKVEAVKEVELSSCSLMDTDGNEVTDNIDMHANRREAEVNNKLSIF